ncbi:hypothetical protein SAMN04489841_0453 [Natrinema salaciae]|uniref:Uncharacterized protein n=1 Tax=Natrinema salaciae TaxID=1186196 RepID=A0A1H9AIA4_9EURY|nr:hypothetical protein SAMN04489841_0453 [Natrinema salaciae]
MGNYNTKSAVNVLITGQHHDKAGYGGYAKDFTDQTRCWTEDTDIYSDEVHNAFTMGDYALDRSAVHEAGCLITDATSDYLG